jgi:RimJ/RimL family protein N-acetyltransferase/aryl carrier-like protein
MTTDTLADPELATRSRESARADLAALLEVEVSMLDDNASLREGLALDSLTMMRLVTWLEARGVVITTEDALPVTVGDVLTRLAKAPRWLTVRMNSVSPVSAPIPKGPPRDPLAPVLETRALRLTPIVPDDVGFLYALAVQPETGFRWRYRGSVPPFERFKAELWNQVLLQFVVRRIEDNSPVGHVVAYGDELSLRHTYVGAVFHPQCTGTGLAAQAVSLFIRYLFHTFPLDKIYMEVPGFNWPQVRSGQASLFRVEGVLRDHEYYAGRYWDKHICAVYPDDLEPADPPAS